MRAAASLVCLCGLLFASSAFAAQSTTELQAIGQAAAKKYGVPWDIFKAQIDGESSWNPNISCSSANACGIAQFIPSTAREMGVDTSDVTSSLYGAAAYDAKLYNQTGSWSKALTRYTGGLTASSPGNQAYRTAFAAAAAGDAAGLTPAEVIAGDGSGIALGDGSLATTPNGSTTSGTTASDPTSSTGTITVGTLGSPWQWMWDQLVVNTQTALDTGITNMETMISAVIGGLLLLAIAAMGLRGALRHADTSDFVTFFIKAGFILAFVSVGSGYYTDYVVTPVRQLPTWWQTYLVGTSSSPIATFNWVDTQTYAVAVAIRNSLPWHAIDSFIFIALARLFIWLALLAMFLAKAGFTLFVGITTVVGPLIIPTALFPRTEYMFWGWVSVVVTALLSLLGIDIVLNLYGQIMILLMQAVTNTEQSLWGCALAMVVMGMSVAFIPMMWHRIGGGVSASLGHARRFLSGEAPAGIIGGAAVAAGGVAAVAAGASAGTTMAITRMTSAVGSSLSRGL